MWTNPSTAALSLASILLVQAALVATYQLPAVDLGYAVYRATDFNVGEQKVMAGISINLNRV